MNQRYLPIRYLQGDATRPVGFGSKVIAHICNDRGYWGSGFVLSLRREWPEAERRYRQLQFPAAQGFTQFVQVSPEIAVANLIAQHDPYGSRVPIDYDSLRICLQKVGTWALNTNSSVHCPRIGTGLAGGTWSVIEGIIQETLSFRGVQVYVYDLPASQAPLKFRSKSSTRRHRTPGPYFRNYN